MAGLLSDAVGFLNEVFGDTVGPIERPESGAQQGPFPITKEALPFSAEDYAFLFRSQPCEFDAVLDADAVQGVVPRELRGKTLFGNGPGCLQLAGAPIHPLDAHGYVRSLSFPAALEDCVARPPPMSPTVTTRAPQGAPPSAPAAQSACISLLSGRGALAAAFLGSPPGSHGLVQVVGEQALATPSPVSLQSCSSSVPSSDSCLTSASRTAPEPLRYRAKYVRTRTYQEEIIERNSEVRHRGSGTYLRPAQGGVVAPKHVASHTVVPTRDGIYVADERPGAPYLLDSELDTVGRAPFSFALLHELPGPATMLAHTASDPERNTLIVCSCEHVVNTKVSFFELDADSGELSGTPVTRHYPGFCYFHDFVFTRHFIVLIESRGEVNARGLFRWSLGLGSFNDMFQMDGGGGKETGCQSRIHLIPRHFAHDYADVDVDLPPGIFVNHLANAFEIVRSSFTARATQSSALWRTRRGNYSSSSDSGIDEGGVRVPSPTSVFNYVFDQGSTSNQGQPGKPPGRPALARKRRSRGMGNTVVIQAARASELGAHGVYGFDEESGTFDARRARVGGTGLLELRLELSACSMHIRRLDAAAASDNHLFWPEYPTVNPLLQGSETRFVYAAYSLCCAVLVPYQAIGKVDRSSGRVTAVFQAGARQFVSEPLFVPRGDAADAACDEDAGTVVTNLFDAAKQQVSTLMLDARTLEPVCVVRMPGLFPYCMHGAVAQSQLARQSGLRPGPRPSPRP